MRITEDDTRDSELKVREEFNNCPGGAALKKALDEQIDVYSFTDIDVSKEAFWQNEEDTLVVSWIGNDAKRAFEIGKIARGSDADEFDYKVIDVIGNKMTIVRLWWD